MRTEAELTAAAENLTAAALALNQSLDTARRLRRRDRVVIVLGLLMVAALSVLTGLSLRQSRDNGQVLRIMREVTSDEAREASDARLAAAIDELDRRLSAEITAAINQALCELREGSC